MKVNAEREQAHGVISEPGDVALVPRVEENRSSIDETLVVVEVPLRERRVVQKREVVQLHRRTNIITNPCSNTI